MNSSHAYYHGLQRVCWLTGVRTSAVCYLYFYTHLSLNCLRSTAGTHDSQTSVVPYSATQLLLPFAAREPSEADVELFLYSDQYHEHSVPENCK